MALTDLALLVLLSVYGPVASIADTHTFYHRTRTE